MTADSDLIRDLQANTATIEEAQEYTDKLTADRLNLVRVARANGVTWRQIELATGSTRQTLTKGMTR